MGPISVSNNTPDVRIISVRAPGAKLFPNMIVMLFSGKNIKNIAGEIIVMSIQEDVFEYKLENFFFSSKDIFSDLFFLMIELDIG